MAVFHVYIDESGKLAKSDFTSLCGYVAHDTEWERFGQMWDSCRLAWQVPPIHVALIMRPDTTPAKRNDPWASVRSNWADSWIDRRDAMLRDFSGIIGSTGLVAVGAVLDGDKYRELHASQDVLEKTGPNVFALHHVAMRSIERVLTVDPNGVLSLVIDDDEEHVGGYYKMLSGLRRHQETSIFGHVGKRIHGICLCNDASYPGLQAADMLAHISRDLMVRSKLDSASGPSESYFRITRGLMHQPVFYGAEMLESVVLNAAETRRRANEESS